MVKVTIGEIAFEFDAVQDSPGMDCGFAIDERKLEVSPCLRYASHTSTYMQGSTQVTNEATIAVCEIEIGEPSVKFYTIVNGLNGLKEPLIGRFLVQDTVQRVYSGILSTPSTVYAYKCVSSSPTM